MSRFKALADASGVSPRIGVRGLPLVADGILDRLLAGESPDAVMVRLATVAIRDGYGERPLTRDDIEAVARFITAARGSVDSLDQQIAGLTVQRTKIAALLAPGEAPQ